MAGSQVIRSLFKKEINAVGVVDCGKYGSGNVKGLGISQSIAVRP